MTSKQSCQDITMCLCRTIGKVNRINVKIVFYIQHINVYFRILTLYL